MIYLPWNWTQLVKTVYIEKLWEIGDKGTVADQAHTP